MPTEPRVNRGRQRNDAARAARAKELAQVQRDFMRLDEFATRVGMSYQKAYTLAHEGGKIPARQLGREWYVPIRAYERWIAEWPGLETASEPCRNCGHLPASPVAEAHDSDGGQEELEEVLVDEPAVLFEPDHYSRREVVR